jgi:Fe-S-cluster containining protein
MHQRLVLVNYMGSEVYGDAPFRFKCTDECRKDPLCCKGHIFLIQEDSSSLAKHFSLSNEDFFLKYCSLFYVESQGKIDGWYSLVLKKSKNGYCVLLNTKNRTKSCSVNGNSEPYICRSYPVFLKEKDLYYMRMCPGTRDGDIHTTKEWVEKNRGIDLKNGMDLIIKKQSDPFSDDFEILSQLIRKKDFGKAEKLKDKIKKEQQKIVMETFGIKI